MRAPAAGATVVARAGDASITHDTQAGTWSLAAGGATLTLTLDPARDFQITRLVSTANRSWTVGLSPDTTVKVEGVSLQFGVRSAGFQYRDVSVSSTDTSLRLDAVFELPERGLRVTRHYSVISGSPTFETWNTYAPTGGQIVRVSDFNAFQLTVPNGTLHWLSGLQGDAADVEHDSAFTLQQKLLAAGERVTLGAQGRSSEQTVPWFAVDGAATDEFYAALMWSGAWSLTASRSGAALALRLGLGPMTAELRDRSVDGPHALFGVTKGSLAQATAALRSYEIGGVRGGRPLTPLVTYNTWFAYGTDISEASMKAEMDRAVALGIELFVVDAGWYAGAGANGPMDFDSGLGSWQPDPTRFPNGLQPLTAYAHSLGMKFGLWVEPARMSLSLIGQSDFDESWLATSDGAYGSETAGLICFGSKAARQWVLDQLTTIIDAVQPDYLKWDNNLWLNCNREGHNHSASDGNFAQIAGLYDLLAKLREQYPDLLIENVSGGGNRLDVGMLRYTDVAWMDDRSAPSVHVRHNIEGLSVVFPPAYLLSFVMDHETEPLHDAPDLSLLVRSRMVGALGLCFRGDSLSEGDLAEMAHQIDIYKMMRATLSDAAGALLTAQAAVDNGPAWDVLQETAAGGAQILLGAFQSNGDVTTITVKPHGLEPTTTYEVRSVDLGLLGTATGAELMTDGIEVIGSPNTAAHILIITARPDDQ